MEYHCFREAPTIAFFESNVVDLLEDIEGYFSEIIVRNVMQNIDLYPRIYSLISFSTIFMAAINRCILTSSFIALWFGITLMSSIVTVPSFI